MNFQAKLAKIKEPEPVTPPVSVSDGTPHVDKDINWAFLSQCGMIAVGFVSTMAALYFAKSIVMPVCAALIIGITLSPIEKRAAEHHVPPAVTALLLVVLFFGALYFATTWVVGPITDWVSKAPNLTEIVKEKARVLERPAKFLHDLKRDVAGGTTPSATPAPIDSGLNYVMQQIAASVTPAISEFLVFFGTLLFFLIGNTRLRRQLVKFFESREARLRVLKIWNDIEHNLIRYLATVTGINLGLGLVTGVMLYLIGFPTPISFGVLAVVLNYVPYLGPAVLVLTLFVVGLLATPTLQSALLAPALFVAIATVEGHFITPSIVGRRLTLSPFLVFLALAFWTWMWGPLGTLMATPLLIVSLVVLGHLFPREENPLPK